MGHIRKRKDKHGKYRYQMIIDVYRNRNRFYKVKTFSDEESALKWERAFLCELDKGIVTTDSIRRRTVAEAIEAFIREKMSKRPKYAQPTQKTLAWWEKRIGHVQLSEATQPVFSRCVDQLSSELGPKGKIRKNGTVLRYIATMSAVLEFCIRKKFWITLNPLRMIERPPLGKSKKRAFTVEEIRRIQEGCAKSESRSLFPVFTIALHTGMRKGEILNLRWIDIDFKNKEIRLPTSKNGEPRDIPMTPEVERILRALAAKSDTRSLIFPSPKNSEKPIDIRSAWERVLKSVGITNSNFHKIRHTFCTFLAQLNISSLLSSRIAGHADPRTTEMIYTHCHKDTLHVAIGKLGEFLEKT